MWWLQKQLSTAANMTSTFCKTFARTAAEKSLDFQQITKAPMSRFCVKTQTLDERSCASFLKKNDFLDLYC